MTVPAPQSSSSASAQQSSSSSGASSPAPTIAHDTVSQGTSVTGLAGVFAERDARDLADKIAQAVSSHVQEQNRKHEQDPSHNKEIERIRVIGDLSGLSDITTLRVLTGQAAHLGNQITAYLKVAPPVEPWPQRGVEEEIAGAIAGTALNLFGVITQMVAGTYTYNGQSIPSGSVGGLDILIANLLSRQLDSDTLLVRVDRFAAPLPDDSGILMQIQGLVSRAADELNPAIARAASNAAAKTQSVTDDKDRLTALADEKKIALDKKPPLEDPDKLQQQYDGVFQKLPGKSGDAARAQNVLAEGQALAAAISAFVAAAMSAPAAGGPPPAARAAHGEVLSEEGTALLYAQVVAAGDDQILRQDLIHNTWTNLTGLTAEYALMIPGQGNEAVAFGLQSTYAVRHGSIRKGLKDVVRKELPQMD